MSKCAPALLPQSASPPVQTPWRDRPFLQLKVASEIVGLSIASLYRFSDQGRLRFRVFGGRTLVDTKSLIALVDTAQEWVPRDRGKEARAQRRKSARCALER